MFNRRNLFTSAIAASVVAADGLLPTTALAQARGGSRNASGRIRMKDSTELYVKDWGSGRPVVLTHAWPLSSDCWDQQAIALVGAGHRVITYDRRGFGRSGHPPNGYTYDTFADDLATVIAQIGLKDVTLVGFSMGGGEIARYLSRHGAKNVVKAGLVATVVPGLAKSRSNPNGVDPSFFEGIKDNLRKDRPSFLAGLLKDVFYDVTTSAKSTNPITQPVLDWSLQMAMQASLPALIGSVDAFGQEDFTADLAAVTVPTLILHGTADKPVSIELGRRAAKGIAKSKLVEYEGASHGLLVTERDRVTRDLIEFLAG